MKVITAKDYIAAKDKLAHLDAWIQFIGDRFTREDVAAERILRDHVERLEKAYHSGLSKRAEQKDMMKAPLIEEKMAAETYIIAAGEILKHLSLKDEIEKAELTEPHPEFYHEKIEAEGDFHRDEYTWIRYCIVKNKKPKNCYSLLIVGNSKIRKLFDGRHLYGYGLTAMKGGYPIQMGLRDAPTVQELLTGLEKNKADSGPLITYLGIRDRYVDTIRNYTLEDFEEIEVIREATEANAPIVFITEHYDKRSIFRIYKGFYYASIDAVEDEDKLRYLKVGGELYLRGARAEDYTIKQTGNLMFGDWWSFGFEAGGSGVPFNKENWERELAETEAFVNERRTPKTSFTPPRISWIHPELIPPIPSF